MTRPRAESGKRGKDPLAWIVALGMIVPVAGMMHHIFAASGIDTILEGLTSGLGLGAFVVSPWLVLTAGFEARSWRRGLTHAWLATSVCGVIGAVLILMA